MCGMARATHNSSNFVSKVDGVYVMPRREWSTNDLCSCIHYALQGFSVIASAASTPYSDVARKDTLNGATIESSHDG